MDPQVQGDFSEKRRRRWCGEKERGGREERKIEEREEGEGE